MVSRYLCGRIDYGKSPVDYDHCRGPIAMPKDPRTRDSIYGNPSHSRYLIERAIFWKSSNNLRENRVERRNANGRQALHVKGLI